MVLKRDIKTTLVTLSLRVNSQIQEILKVSKFERKKNHHPIFITIPQNEKGQEIIMGTTSKRNHYNENM